MVKIYGAFTRGQTLCQVLSKHYLFASSQQVQEGGAVFTPILHMRKLRPKREVICSRVTQQPEGRRQRPGRFLQKSRS